MGRAARAIQGRGEQMNFIRNILLFAILLTLIVTCSNIQSIRDEYVSKPNKVEESVSNLIDRVMPKE